MTVFYVGKKDLFLNTLGIKYGFLGIEGVDVRGVVMDIWHTREVLELLTKQQTITSDEAQELETSMRRAGISEDEKGYIDAVLKYELPKDFEANLEFRMCDQVKGNPVLRHGHIAHTEGGADVGGIVSTIVDGFNLCHTIARNAEGDMEKILDAVHALQQITKSDLPFDEREQRERFESLELYRGSGRMTSLSDLLSALMGHSFGRGF